MQRCSHSTRAYFVNANMLKAFLVVKPIIRKASFQVKVCISMRGWSLYDPDLLVDEFMNNFQEFSTKLLDLKT